MSSSTTQYPLPLPHLKRMSAEDFMISDSNSEAAAWIDRWPEWPSHCLIVHGPLGTGKTHLANVWQGRSKALPLTPNDLSVNQVEGRFFIIDNADGVAGIAAAEENLFHLFNRLREDQGSLLLTSTTPPAQWGLKLPDLRSRLVASLAVALQSPDDALLTAMLIKQFGDCQLQIESGVIDYILPRIERSAAAVRQMVIALDKASLATQRAVTVAMAREFLVQNQPKAEDDNGEET